MGQVLESRKVAARVTHSGPPPACTGAGLWSCDSMIAVTCMHAPQGGVVDLLCQFIFTFLFVNFD